MAPPGTFVDGANITASGNPLAEVARDRTLIIQPELTVGLARVVVPGGYSPGAGGKDHVGPHQAQGSTDHLTGSKPVGANHEPERSQRSADDSQTVTLRVHRVGKIEFVELAMMEQHFAFRRDEDGAVEEMIVCALDQSGANVDAMFSRRITQAHARSAIGNGSGVGECGVVAPTAIERFRQQDDGCSGIGGLGDVFDGATQVFFSLTADDGQLGECELEAVHWKVAIIAPRDELAVIVEAGSEKVRESVVSAEAQGSSRGSEMATLRLL